MLGLLALDLGWAFLAALCISRLQVCMFSPQHFPTPGGMGHLHLGALSSRSLGVLSPMLSPMRIHLAVGRPNSGVNGKERRRRLGLV